MHILENPAPCAVCGHDTIRTYNHVPICVLCRSSQVRAALAAHRIRQPEEQPSIYDRIVGERLAVAEGLAKRTGTACAQALAAYWRRQASR